MSAEVSGFRRLAHGAMIGLGLLCGAVAHQPATAAPASSSAALAMRDDEIRIVNGVLEIFAEVMDPNDRQILQAIDVRIPMDYDITRVVAYRDGDRVIEVSFGFFGTMVELCDALILSEYYAPQDPGIYDKVDEYLKYLNRVIDQNERSVDQKQHIQHFTEYVGIPAATAAQILGRSETQEISGLLRVAAIAFVLAHEIGHHILGHVDAPPNFVAESRNREVAADRYAAALTMRAGISPFGALPALAFFSGAEGDRVDPDASHPLTYCRVMEAMLYTVDRLPGNTPLFENSPGLRPGGLQYNTLLTKIREHCA